MKVWLLFGDTYEGGISHAIFSEKPTRLQLKNFIVTHYDDDEEVVVSKDYTIQLWKHGAGGWIRKERNFEQFLDDILAGVDINDGEDYGTYFNLTEVEVQ